MCISYLRCDKHTAKHVYPDLSLKQFLSKYLELNNYDVSIVDYILPNLIYLFNESIYNVNYEDTLILLTKSKLKTLFYKHYNIIHSFLLDYYITPSNPNKAVCFTYNRKNFFNNDDTVYQLSKEYHYNEIETRMFRFGKNKTEHLYFIENILKRTNVSELDNENKNYINDIEEEYRKYCNTEYFYKVKTKHNRFYSYYSSLSKKQGVRQKLTIDGKKTIEIDIKNSGSVFLVYYIESIINLNNKAEFEFVENTYNGTIYELFRDTYNEINKDIINFNNIDREWVKKNYMQMMYSWHTSINEVQNAKKGPLFKIMLDKFPNIADFIKNCSNSKDKLSKQMRIEEGKFVINVMNALKLVNVDVLPLHDCFIIKSEDYNKFMNVLDEKTFEYFKHLGHYPTFDCGGKLHKLNINKVSENKNAYKLSKKENITKDIKKIILKRHIEENYIIHDFEINIDEIVKTLKYNERFVKEFVNNNYEVKQIKQKKLTKKFVLTFINNNQQLKTKKDISKELGISRMQLDRILK